MARKPNTSTGTVLPNRWAQLTCSNGAQMMSSEPGPANGVDAVRSREPWKAVMFTSSTR